MLDTHQSAASVYIPMYTPNPPALRHNPAGRLYFDRYPLKIKPPAQKLIFSIAGRTTTGCRRPVCRHPYTILRIQVSNYRDLYSTFLCTDALNRVTCGEFSSKSWKYNKLNKPVILFVLWIRKEVSLFMQTYL